MHFFPSLKEICTTTMYITEMGLAQYLVIGGGIFLAIVVPICLTVIVVKCFMKTKVRVMPMMPAVDDGSEQDEAWSFQMTSTATSAPSSFTRGISTEADTLHRKVLQRQLTQEHMYANVPVNPY